MSAFLYLCLGPLPTLAFADPQTSSEETSGPRVFGYRLVAQYPHDAHAFTEGLFYKDGYLFERTGLYGHSSLRKIRLKTGAVVQERPDAADIFGEGIAEFKGRIIGLSWQSGQGFVWDGRSFRLVNRFHYEGEGWGLTQNGHELIQSDGSATVKFLDPVSFEIRRRIEVRLEGRAVTKLNELEWVGGEIFANVWQKDVIVRINPQTGEITGIIDLTGLVGQANGGVAPRDSQDDVLNGIAYDCVHHRLFVTGKNWPRIFQIQLFDKASGRIDPVTP